jgi:hypothetical protein
MFSHQLKDIMSIWNTNILCKDFLQRMIVNEGELGKQGTSGGSTDLQLASKIEHFGRVEVRNFYDRRANKTRPKAEEI